MKKLVPVPFLGANDTECVLIKWDIEVGARVGRGTTICSVETTKSVIEIDADTDGFVYPLAEQGDNLQEGDPLALLSDSEVADVELARRQLETTTKPTTSEDSGITKKAEVLLTRHGVSVDDVRATLGTGRITEAAVQEFLATKGDDARDGFVTRHRVGIVGGATGGGALIVIDALLRGGRDQATCIFDANPAVHGKSILGVPVVGSFDELDNWFERSEFDSVVIAFNRDLGARQRVFETLNARGVPFANVIDSTVNIRSNVEIGTGNVILGSAYIGACTLVGDNNFLSSNVCLEHGNVLGSHCAFGPGVVTSGNVKIGNGIRFGTGIFIEPRVSIGDGAVVASGSVITKDVPPDTIVKHRENVVARIR